MPDKFIVTNFSYGTGPYLRTTELALAFNDELERYGKKRLGIIVPWVYRERQRQVMLEEFPKKSDEIFLEEKLGKILRGIFYGNYGHRTYENALAHWLSKGREASRDAKERLSGKFPVFNLRGEKFEMDGRNIVLELSRSPRIRYDVAPSYFTSFGYISQILEEAYKIPWVKINVSGELLKKGARFADWVESSGKIQAKAYPATFSWRENYVPRYSTEVLAPPLTRLYDSDEQQLEPGIFVTVTGILGLERLYQDARRLGLKIYSNDPQAVPGSVRALPHIIPNPNIVFQFARSGWSSAWLSMISKTPLVVPDFDPRDDPEIYFNNLALERLGIGIVYHGQRLEEILERREELRKVSQALSDKILARWGTLDGNHYCAKLFVDDFLKGA